ncbi:hypothetical protein L3X38_024576 [Prunus dulcis]|uniref:Uncharacterized protein n=1 Tax=Prunus dulcis TaxID=3755 RepID=A0AAD4W064_PRUDU|nr:hypothetical protein L3X38_024576 [Prunus dulcis]
MDTNYAKRLLAVVSFQRGLERNRLWVAEDIYHVLKNKTGTKKVQCMLFNMAEYEDQLHLSCAAFKKMSNLSLLKFIILALATAANYAFLNVPSLFPILFVIFTGRDTLCNLCHQHFLQKTLLSF